jgi:hypothetical protein
MATTLARQNNWVVKWPRCTGAAAASLAQSDDRLARLCAGGGRHEGGAPHVDLFAPAHNLESLQALEPYLARI